MRFQNSVISPRQSLHEKSRRKEDYNGNKKIFFIIAYYFQFKESGVLTAMAIRGLAVFLQLKVMDCKPWVQIIFIKIERILRKHITLFEE